MEKREIAVFWFRRDLRLEDNRALWEALCSGSEVLPLFIFDTAILSKLSNNRDKRVDFIYKTLCSIDSRLKKIGSSLTVVNGLPVSVFEDLCNRYNIKAIYCNDDYEPYAVQRDIEVEELLKKRGAKLLRFKDQVIFEKGEILKGDGTPYTVFTPYSKRWIERFNTDPENFAKHYPSETLLDKMIKTEGGEMPTLETFGFNPSGPGDSAPDNSGLIFPWDYSKGEFQKHIFNSDIITDYHNTRNYPALKGTSLLSVHLRFGTVSIRDAVKVARKLNGTWLNELIWREFFKMILYNFPYVTDAPFKRKYSFIEWRNESKDLERWCNGTTGYPLVDAGMRELNQTGLMHNRVRMVTASFLVKHLLIDWRIGEAYFAEKLLDYDLSSNNGNWQWAAGCGCDAAPYFRIFNPVEQAAKYDPDNEYIFKWVPELKPENRGLKNYTVYPVPLVDNKKARERALEVYKRSLNEFGS
ncbi:MAG: deoxyribodipyrimidine photo-lyase [Bacteroidales bacterium]